MPEEDKSACEQLEQENSGESGEGSHSRLQTTAAAMTSLESLFALDNHNKAPNNDCEPKTTEVEGPGLHGKWTCPCGKQYTMYKFYTNHMYVQPYASCASRSPCPKRLLCHPGDRILPDKAYVCECCSKAFKTKKAHDTHIRGNMPASCPCGKKMPFKAIARHKRTCLVNRVVFKYECIHCGFKGVTKKGINAHARTRHPEKIGIVDHFKIIP